MKLHHEDNVRCPKCTGKLLYCPLAPESLARQGGGGRQQLLRHRKVDRKPPITVVAAALAVFLYLFASIVAASQLFHMISASFC